MRPATRHSWFFLLVALALWPAGCSQPAGTYVKLKFTGAVSQNQPIHSITVNLQFDSGNSATATFQMPSGADIKLDATAVLDIQHGQGPLTVVASALSADGGLLGTGSGSGTVVRDKTVEITVTFNISVPDAGVDSLPPTDGPIPGLDGNADLATRDTPDVAADVSVAPDLPVLPDTIVPSDSGPDHGGGVNDGGPDVPAVGGAGGAGGAGGTAAGGSSGAGGTAAGGAGGTRPDGSSGGFILTVNPPSVDFGVIVPGTVSPPKTLTITNKGDAPTPALALSNTDPKTFPLGTDLCSTRVLQPSDTCTVEFKFAPGTSGTLRADGAVEPVGGGTGAKFTLSGTGAGGPATLTLSPPSATLAAVDVGTKTAVDFTLTNGGDSDAGTIRVQVSGPNAFQLANSGCGNGTLGPRSQCVFTVTFAPTAYGPTSASIQVLSTSGLSASATISGTGRDYVALNIKVVGNGTVTGGPQTCTSGNVCNFSIPRTDPTAPPQFTLTAQPDSLSVFAGWTGDCTGTGTCSLTMNAGHSVTATFNPRMVMLNVTVFSLAGHTGSLVSDDGSVNCSGDCPNLSVPASASFTLNVKPASGSTFAGWTSGPCKGLVAKCTFAPTDGMMISATFAPQNYMFVSSSLVIPGKLTTLDAADTECAKLAANAGLPGHYAAWLSTAAIKAGSRIGPGGWLRTDGRPFGRDLKSVIDPAYDSVFYPPRLDERANDLGNSQRTLVATGSLVDGTSSGSNCKDFTDTTASLTTGDAAAGAFAWTNYSVDLAGCANPRHLYCFRTDLDAVLLNPPPQPGRRIFVSTNPFVMGGSSTLTPTDLCRKDADAAGIADPTTFVAFISTGSTPALKLVRTTGLPWRRMDGVFVTQLPADFANGKLLAPIDTMADGKTYANANVWTGATDPTMPGTGTCGDWTGNGTSTGGLVGDGQTSVTPLWFDLMTIPCTNLAAHVYCIEP